MPTIEQKLAGHLTEPPVSDPSETAHSMAATLAARVDPVDTRLLTQPAIGATHIAFVYAGDLWSAKIDGSDVRRLTSDDGGLSRVQQAFVDNGAYQCAYCIPGMVVTVEACLADSPDASMEEVREYLAGNLCRCGTYVSILEAVTELVRGERE